MRELSKSAAATPAAAADLFLSTFNYILTLFKRKEFSTTESEEKAIAAAAKIGFNKIPKNGYKTPAATGIKAVL